MADLYETRAPSADDGWGPARSVRSASYDATRTAPAATAATATPAAPTGAPHAAQPYVPRRSRPVVAPAATSPSTGAGGRELVDSAVPRPAHAPGLPSWAALLLLVGITLLGSLADAARGQQLAAGFNIGIIGGSVIAIVLVRRAGMFPVVVAPPIVYSVTAGLSLYVRSSGLSNHSILLDAATNWLTYGFPAIAGATAAVLIIAGARLIVRR